MAFFLVFFRSWENTLFPTNHEFMPPLLLTLLFCVVMVCCCCLYVCAPLLPVAPICASPRSQSPSLPGRSTYVLFPAHLPLRISVKTSTNIWAENTLKCYSSLKVCILMGTLENLKALKTKRNQCLMVVFEALWQGRRGWKEFQISLSTDNSSYGWANLEEEKEITGSS